MYKLLTFALISLLAIPALAADPVIGIFADETPAAENCYATITPYVPTMLYVIATWDVGAMGQGITAAEFKIDNFPTNDGYPDGTVTVNHTTDLIIGDIWGDYSAAWSTPQDEGSQFTICSIEVLAFDAAWISGEVVSTVVVGDDCSCLVLVDDLFEIHDATGGKFTFNCGAPPCDCGIVAAEPSTWSSVKALF